MVKRRADGVDPKDNLHIPSCWSFTLAKVKDHDTPFLAQIENPPYLSTKHSPGC